MNLVIVHEQHNERVRRHHQPVLKRLHQVQHFIRHRRQQQRNRPYQRKRPSIDVTKHKEVSKEHTGDNGSDYVVDDDPYEEVIEAAIEEIWK